MSVEILPWFLLLFFALSVSPSSSSSSSSSDIRIEVGTAENPAAWQVLSRKNFSSQIQLHPHILLLVTVPWSGEARSLMKEIVNKSESRKLKLMVIYRNLEKVIADMLGVSEGTKIIYYRNTVPFKYNGRLRALNILSSISQAISLQEDEIPLKPLNQIDEIEDFVESAEKSVFLFELCDWSTKLMQHDNAPLPPSNKFQNVAREGLNFMEAPTFKDKTMIENEELYGADVSISPWEKLGLISANLNISEENYERRSTCTKREFEKFTSFYREFISISKDHFLPLEKQRFSLVSNKSFLPYLGVNNNLKNWGVLVRYSSCPNCSVLVRESDELRNILLGHHPLVKESEREDQSSEVSFPSNRPSLVLFIDTSSESPEIRSESKLALEIVRKYAWENRNYIAPHKNSRHKIITKKDSSEQSKSESKAVKIKENIIVINQQNLGDDNNNNNDNLVDLLSKLLQQTRDNLDRNKEKKISMVAKELGFQLLSGDFSVNPASDSNNTSLIHEKDNNGINSEISEENELISTNFDNKLEKEVKIEKMDDEISINDNLSFKGSIYYSNGDLQLLNSLTSKSKIPSLVIINPITQKHYVYSEQTPISFTSLQNFINNFVNQSLHAYIKSEPLVRKTNELPKIPSMNLDFHEADGLPRVGANELCELVLGFENCEKSEKHTSLERDLLVLFSNSWCGFCSRMELVLREVYRACKHFVVINNISSLNDFPSIYLMDCTRNDCSPFLNSSEKMDVYPSLLLFPAKSKDSFSYQGTSSVINIFEFLETHLNNFKNYRGILWAGTKKPTEPKTIVEEVSSTIEESQTTEVKTEQEASSVTETIDIRDNYQNMVGITFAATDKISATSDLSPFVNSSILIVFNNEEGFQGLIFNRRIRWDIFNDPYGKTHPIRTTPIYYGGPITHNGIVSLSRRPNEGYVEVIKGMYFGNGVATNTVINKIKNGEELIDWIWFFYGYAEWGHEQLFDEMDRGFWNLTGMVTKIL